MPLHEQIDPSYLMISGHDYRSKRQVNVHFIVRELQKLGKTRFLSIGYSPLSLIKHDPRVSLWARSNTIETQKGVECYLWRTLLHPFNLHRKALSWLEARLFKSYARKLPPAMKQWIAETQTIILESGLPLILFNIIKEINPSACIIYLCSDSLGTIGCSSVLIEELTRIAPSFDSIVIPSEKLRAEFPPGCNVHYMPHGMDSFVSVARPLSYEGKTNLVSVGSMLFDKTFFEIAAHRFPQITFHVIGGGKNAAGLSGPNIRLHGEMAFQETLAYIQHADAGIAPYQAAAVAPYLADTSMKLMQFEACGLPAVCPDIATGAHRGRFGYQPGNTESVAAAIQAALSYGRFPASRPLSWAEVVSGILLQTHPQERMSGHG